MSGSKLTIGYSGLSHLGLIHAVASASKGFKIIAKDDSFENIKKLKNNKTNIAEPLLEQLLTINQKNLKFTVEAKDLSKCDIVFISLDVPTDTTGKSDLNLIITNIDSTLKFFKKGTTVVILSQIPPGFTRKIQLKYNFINVYYQVETLIFGEAINRALNPERIIIGCAEPNIELNKTYYKFLEMFNCPILPMVYESAEFTKISINILLAASVTITNTLAEISEKIGANWSEIKPSLQLDKRIGPHSYLNPGLGLSGGNLERDLETVIQLGEENGCYSGTIQAIIENSEQRKNWLWRKFRDTELINIKNSKIALLGLSYKENTASIKNSPSINFLSKLSNYVVSVHDPKVRVNLPNFVTFCDDVYRCIADVDLLVIATPWSEYMDLDIIKVKSIMRGRIIIDPYEVINYEVAKKLGFSYSSLVRSF